MLNNEVETSTHERSLNYIATSLWCIESQQTTSHGVAGTQTKSLYKLPGQLPTCITTNVEVSSRAVRHMDNALNAGMRMEGILHLIIPVIDITAMLVQLKHSSSWYMLREFLKFD